MPESLPPEATLLRECRVFCRHLSGEAPEPIVIQKYLQAHACGVVEPRRGTPALDRWLVRIARTGTLAARWADAYAALFSRRGLLRRKLILLLAILETVPRTSRMIASTSRMPPVVVWLGTLGLGGLAALILVSAVAFFGPFHCVMARRAKEDRSA
jgi:hypothetical protein